MPTKLAFTLDDAQRAHDEWGANCGPGALAAVTGKTLDEVRPHIKGFDEKRYTNPSMMWAALRSMGVKWQSRMGMLTWPAHGLVRIQWDGPWCNPGVTPLAAYRHTHWIAAQQKENPLSIGIFDVNAMSSGGWISLHDWGESLVPWLLKECVPRASGKWWITHAVEVSDGA